MSLTAARIAELRSTVPHLDMEEVDVIGGERSEAETVLAYFRSVAHQFADPGEEGKCVNCGRRQSGLLGAFTWGIVHGEGSCTCGWPARAYHFIEMADGEKKRIIAVLQYHPYGVEPIDP